MLQFVKVAGCEGFHCYETELLTRLEALGMDLLGAKHVIAPAAQLRPAADLHWQTCFSDNSLSYMTLSMKPQGVVS
jgi:hypothetical protein